MANDSDLEIERLREEVARLRRHLYWGGLILSVLFVASLFVWRWLIVGLVLGILLVVYPSLRRRAGALLERGGKHLRGS